MRHNIERESQNNYTDTNKNVFVLLFYSIMCACRAVTSMCQCQLIEVQWKLEIVKMKRDRGVCMFSIVFIPFPLPARCWSDEFVTISLWANHHNHQSLISFCWHHHAAARDCECHGVPSDLFLSSPRVRTNKEVLGHRYVSITQSENITLQWHKVECEPEHMDLGETGLNTNLGIKLFWFG